MLKFSVKTHKNFLNPEYHDTKPSCNFFFSHSRPICTKNMAVISPVTASVCRWLSQHGLQNAASMIFKNKDAYTFGVLASLIAKEVNCEEGTAKKYINFMIKEGILKRQSTTTTNSVTKMIRLPSLSFASSIAAGEHHAGLTSDNDAIFNLEYFVCLNLLIYAH